MKVGSKGKKDIMNSDTQETFFGLQDQDSSFRGTSIFNRDTSDDTLLINRKAPQKIVK